MAVRTEIVLECVLKSTWFSFWCRAARCGGCVCIKIHVLIGIKAFSSLLCSLADPNSSQASATGTEPVRITRTATDNQNGKFPLLPLPTAAGLRVSSRQCI